jgi:predicted transcriptional regulator
MNQPEVSRKMFLRLPPEVKSWVERESERDERTQNAVVVRALRERMAREQREKADR